MDKLGKKLTDRDLIDQVVAWYKLDQSTDQLREAIGTYIKQSASVPATASDAVSHEEPSTSFDERAPLREDVEEFRLVSKPKLESNGLQSNGLRYEPQFEHSDELIPARRWGMDVWALYYGTEDFFQRISFGLLSMQSLAALFCILGFGAVMIGAWQSNLSSERRKTATFKSMEIESADKKRMTSSVAVEEPSPTESQSSEVTTASAEQSPNDLAASTAAANPEPSPATPEPSPTSSELVATTPEPIAPISEPEATTSDSVAASELVKTAPEPVAAAPDAFEVRAKEIDKVRDLMEKKWWKEALAELEKLEKNREKELQPLLTLIQIEALIQIRDKDSMEKARELLMERKFDEYEVHYDLLVARWMLVCGAEHRRRFLNASALLPDTNRERMCAWAQIGNGNKDERTALTLQSYASQGPGYVCDLLFTASFHYNVKRLDEAYRVLLETQQKLTALEVSGKNMTDCWLLESAKMRLAEDIARFLTSVAAQRSQVN